MRFFYIIAWTAQFQTKINLNTDNKIKNYFHLIHLIYYTELLINNIINNKLPFLD